MKRKSCLFELLRDFDRRGLLRDKHALVEIGSLEDDLDNLSLVLRYVEPIAHIGPDLEE